MNVTNIRYHRNGVSGEPFYAFEFTDANRSMLAVIFPLYTEDGEVDWDATANSPRFTYNPRIAILTGSVDDTMRGDYFLDPLCRAAKGWDRGLLHGLEKGAFDD